VVAGTRVRKTCAPAALPCFAKTHPLNINLAAFQK
jgi:hypothetical protein